MKTKFGLVERALLQTILVFPAGLRHRNLPVVVRGPFQTFPCESFGLRALTCTPPTPAPVRSVIDPFNCASGKLLCAKPKPGKIVAKKRKNTAAGAKRFMFPPLPLAREL